MNVKLVDFNTLFKESDYISLHMPLNKETTHMVDAKAFAMAKQGLIIINTGRGGLIDEQALIEALKSGKVGGAGLDVVENIPVQSPLDSMDNVIITPHVCILLGSFFEGSAENRSGTVSSGSYWILSDMLCKPGA